MPTKLIKLFLLVIILLYHEGELKAQRPTLQNEIVMSELNFASTAEKMGLKYAFEQNLDSAGIIANGVQLVNGLKAYGKAKAGQTDLLVWRPSFAFINYGEDFGFTTGPYLYYAQRGKRAVASGNYFSIWKKNSDQKFKLLFDGGVNHTSISQDYHQEVQTLNILSSKLRKPAKSSPAPPFLITTADALDYLDKKVLILRADHPITIGKVHYAPAKEELVYHPIQNGYDKSGSIYYVVGHLYAQNTTLEAKKIKGFYAQVWRLGKKSGAS